VRVRSAIADGFGARLLPVIHDGFHNLGDDQMAELGIRVDLTLFCTGATGHVVFSLVSRARRQKPKAPKPENPYFGRFAPYFERRCLRFLTPWVSRTPRMMW